MVTVIYVRFILVACDGLWKAFDAEEALLFVQKIIKVGLTQDVT